MTGPLTPPPSSALEIQDAARGPLPAVPPQTAVPPVPQQVTTTLPVAPPSSIGTYKDAFLALSELAMNEQYTELIRLAENHDLMVCPTGMHTLTLLMIPVAFFIYQPAETSHPDRLLIIVPLVLSYLIVDNM